MITVYGKPAVLVPQPDGDLAGYQIEGLTPTTPRVERQWNLTSPKGETHTVSEFPSWWRCTCPAFTRFTRHGCKYRVGSQLTCKHIAGLVHELGCADGSHGQEGSPRAAQGVADPARSGDDPGDQRDAPR